MSKKNNNKSNVRPVSKIDKAMADKAAKDKAEMQAAIEATKIQQAEAACQDDLAEALGDKPEATAPVAPVEAAKPELSLAEQCIEAGLTSAKSAVAALPPSTKGKLGSIYGQSVISVMRALGRAGWDYKTIVASVTPILPEPPAERTVRGAIRRGRNPNYTGRVAVLTEEQLASLRVSPATVVATV